MGFDWGRAGLGAATGGLSEYYRLLRPGGSPQEYSPLPFENPHVKVDNNRIIAEFQAAAGRPPTQNEIDSYARYIKTGDLNYADIGQIIQGSPELSKQRLESYADQYGQRLAGQYQSYLDAATSRIGAEATSRFSGLGRPQSSALAASVFGQGGQVAQNLAMQRQSQIAAFYGQGLQNVQAQYQDRGQSALSRAYQLQDNRTAFNRSLLGYRAQRNDANTDLYNQDLLNRKRAYDQLIGGVGGAGLGLLVSGGSPMGAYMGSQFGSQVGGLFGGR